MPKTQWIQWNACLEAFNGFRETEIWSNKIYVITNWFVISVRPSSYDALEKLPSIRAARVVLGYRFMRLLLFSHSLQPPACIHSTEARWPSDKIKCKIILISSSHRFLLSQEQRWLFLIRYRWRYFGAGCKTVKTWSCLEIFEKNCSYQHDIAWTNQVLNERIQPLQHAFRCPFIRKIGLYLKQDVKHANTFPKNSINNVIVASHWAKSSNGMARQGPEYHCM